MITTGTSGFWASRTRGRSLPTSAVEAMHWGLAEYVTTLSETHDVLSKRMPNPKSKSKGEAIMSGKR